MKILQLVTRRQYRGAEVFAADLSAELIDLGHEIIFAGLYKNHKDVLAVEDAVNLDISFAPSGFLSTSLVKKLVKVIREKKPDIVQCNGSDTLKYMIAASFFTLKVPIVYRNISMISEWVNTMPKKIFYKSLFRKVAHVSSVGQEALEDFVCTFNYPRARTSVIRRGIPIKELPSSKFNSELKDKLNLVEEDKLVIHIGNFSPEKNHEFLLDIFSEIKNENSHVKLICVGDGLLFENTKSLIERRNLEDTIFLLGFRKDVPELLAACDCFVLSSKIEGVPGVILEAATQKKPSVATNVGGVSEVLIDGHTGYLINDFNKDNFKNRLMYLLFDEQANKKFGESAYQLVLEEFNPKKNAKVFEDLYQKLRP